MATESPTASMRSSFKFCLSANIVSIVLMFGSAILTGFLSRRYNVAPADIADPSLLVSSHLVATRLALFVGLPAFVIAFAGMIRFQFWARKVFALLVLAWLVQLLGFGLVNSQLTWGLSGVFSDIALLTTGAVLAMSYMTPISGLFERSELAAKSSDQQN